MFFTIELLGHELDVELLQAAFKLAVFIAFVGVWMNSSAGLAFAPHVISVEAGEVLLNSPLILYFCVYRYSEV